MDVKWTIIVFTLDLTSCMNVNGDRVFVIVINRLVSVEADASVSRIGADIVTVNTNTCIQIVVHYSDSNTTASSNTVACSRDIAVFIAFEFLRWTDVLSALVFNKCEFHHKVKLSYGSHKNG